MIITKVKNVKTPSRGTQGSAGIDFFVPEMDEPIYVPENGSALIPSGIKAIVPEGHALIAFNKSGVATKKGLIVGACVVDEDYQGEIHIHVINATKGPVFINPGEKLVQFLLIPIMYSGIREVKTEAFQKAISNNTSERGEGGFGSTGDK